MTEEHSSELTAAEISALWEAYQGDTATVCGLSHFLSHVDDEEIKEILEETLAMSKENVKKLTEIFKNEGYALPLGFTEQDVNNDAPRLFSDYLYLTYNFNMTNLAFSMYSACLIAATRPDIIDYFANNLTSTKELHIKSKVLMQEKEIYSYAPVIPHQKQVDFVEKESFLAGWFTDRRPLLGIEISALVLNAKQNALGQAIITGFSQVAQSKEVRRYFERGRDIAGKHLDIFRSILTEEFLSDGVLIATPQVTDATVSPFSDKLMMTLIANLSSTGLSQYGISMSTSQRRDLSVHYTRLMAEVASYSVDGAKILINNGWMEQPPIAADRKELAK